MLITESVGSSVFAGAATLDLGRCAGPSAGSLQEGGSQLSPPGRQRPLLGAASPDTPSSASSSSCACCSTTFLEIIPPSGVEKCASLVGRSGAGFHSFAGIHGLRVALPGRRCGTSRLGRCLESGLCRSSHTDMRMGSGIRAARQKEDCVAASGMISYNSCAAREKRMRVLHCADKAPSAACPRRRSCSVPRVAAERRPC